MISTVETLGDRSIADEAPRMAKASGIEGIFVLISKKEKKIQVLVSHRYLGETMKRERDLIRTSFTAGFRHGVFDDGLRHGVAHIGEVALRCPAGRRAFRKAGHPAAFRRRRG